MVSLCMTFVKGLILVRMMILLALFLDGMQDFHRLAQAEDKQQQHQRSGTSHFYPLEEQAISLAQRLRRRDGQGGVLYHNQREAQEPCS